MSVIKYKDPNNLREKISYLFEHQDIAEEYGHNARKLIDKKYSIKQHVTEVLNVFNQVVKK